MERASRLMQWQRQWFGDGNYGNLRVPRLSGAWGARKESSAFGVRSQGPGMPDCSAYTCFSFAQRPEQGVPRWGGISRAELRRPLRPGLPAPLPSGRVGLRTARRKPSTSGATICRYFYSLYHVALGRAQAVALVCTEPLSDCPRTDTSSGQLRTTPVYHSSTQ